MSGKKKVWIAVAEHPHFTQDDHHIFKVFFTGQKNQSGYCLSPAFISADNTQELRVAAHAAVDRYFDQIVCVAVLEEASEEKKIRREELMSAEMVADSDVNSLSIGGFVNKPKKEGAEGSDGLLDLDDFK